MATPASALQLKSANRFEFIGHSGKTKVSYSPFAGGPIIQGQEVGPIFEYAGPEGSLAFRGTQITQQDSASGKLLTVVLKPQSDAGSTAFSLFLPAVFIGASGGESFRTFGVKSHHAGLAAKPGAQITYESECFEGDAKAEFNRF